MTVPRRQKARSLVNIRDKGAIRTVTLNRPRVLNALNGPLIQQLHVALTAPPAAIRCIVLTGAGGNFCSGGDRRDGIAIDGEDKIGLHLLQEICSDLRSPRVVSLAAIEGWAVGGGLELAMACDIAIAASDARIRLPDVEVGAHVTGGASWLLPRIVGLQRTSALLFGGYTLSGAEAAMWGLVAASGPPGKALNAAQETALRISKLPIRAVRAAKASLQSSLEGSLDAALQREFDATLLLLRKGGFLRRPL
jgi:enoyl-CoA hydratase/carnithine racemase